MVFTLLLVEIIPPQWILSLSLNRPSSASLFFLSLFYVFSFCQSLQLCFFSFWQTPFFAQGNRWPALSWLCQSNSERCDTPCNHFFIIIKLFTAFWRPLVSLFRCKTKCRLRLHSFQTIYNLYQKKKNTVKGVYMTLHFMVHNWCKIIHVNILNYLHWIRKRHHFWMQLSNNNGCLTWISNKCHSRAEQCIAQCSVVIYLMGAFGSNALQTDPRKTESLWANVFTFLTEMNRDSFSTDT